MAVIQSVANSAILKCRWSGESRTWLNVLGLVFFNGTPVFSQGTVETIWTAMKAQSFLTTFMAQLAPTVVFEGISLRNFSAPNQPEFTSAGAPLSGGGTGDALPLSVATCITIRTAMAGKRFRGRVYLTGFSEAANDATGRITSTASAAANAWITNLNSALTPSNLNLAVLSRPRNGKTIPAKVTSDYAGQVTPATSFITRDLKWESQRRRTGKT